MQARDHRELVQADAEAVAELEPERGVLVPHPDLLGRRPHLRDLVGRDARPDEVDRRVEPLAALPVGVELGGRRVADVERAVVARPVAHERVDDVEERLVARAQQPVGERVRVRVAAVAGDRVDRLDVLRAELEEHLHRRRDDLVLAHARAQHPVDLLVGRVDDPGRVVEQRQLVGRLDLPRLEHHRLRVGEMQALALEREQRRRVGNVDPERLLVEAALAQLVVDHRRERVRDTRLVGHRAAHRRDPRAPARLGQPGAVELVMARRRAEVPEDRVARRGRRARSGCSCRAPTSRSPCSSRSGGCSDRRAGGHRAPRPRAPPSSARAGPSGDGRSRPAAPSRPPSSLRATRCSSCSSLPERSSRCSAILHTWPLFVNT